MTQTNRTDPEFVQEVERLADAWESSLERNSMLSYERETDLQLFGQAVHQVAQGRAEFQVAANSTITACS